MSGYVPYSYSERGKAFREGFPEPEKHGTGDLMKQKSKGCATVFEEK
jgi:hypothetical protein